MRSMNTYLIFQGNCRQAMEFYKKCIGGELHLVPYADMPGGCSNFPKEARDWIMHARLSNGDVVLMASDTQPHIPIQQGNNFFISIQCDNVQESEKLFKAFGQKGTIEMPLQETFWALRFGMLTDQFGMKWMFNLDKPGQKNKKTKKPQEPRGKRS